MVIVKTENRSSNNRQKTSLQSNKTQIKILPFPGLALSGSEHPGPRSYAFRLALIYILILSCSSALLAADQFFFCTMKQSNFDLSILNLVHT